MQNLGGCDLQLGYSWLHLAVSLRLIPGGCDLQLGYSWLHYLLVHKLQGLSCDLQLGYSWLHLTVDGIAINIEL